METAIKIVFNLLSTALAAFFGWWLFPDRIMDLSYAEWFLVALVFESLYSSASFSDKLDRKTSRRRL